MSKINPDSEIGQMIRLCEDEYDAEKWDENGPTRIFNGLQSIALCNSIGHYIESKYHLKKYATARAGISRARELSSLLLFSPEMRLNKGTSVRPSSIQAIGDIGVGYSDIVIAETLSSSGLQYAGPHLTGIVDTDAIGMAPIPNTEYNFTIPLKLVAFSPQHIARDFN